MKRYFRVFIFMFSTTLPFPALAASVNITSQNIKNLLEPKNLKILASVHEKEAAEEREGSLARSFLPSLEMYGGYQGGKSDDLSTTQTVYGIEVNVNLYNGGRDSIENDVRSLETKKRAVQSQRIISEELAKARTIYWQILFLSEKRALLESALKMNKQNLQAAQKRIRTGVATDSDRFEFEMKEVDLSREMAETDIQIVTQENLLKVVIGLNESDKLSFTESFAHDHEYEIDLKHSVDHADFLYKELEIQANQHNLVAKKNKRDWWPKVDAFAAYNQNNPEVESADTATRPGTNGEESVLGVRLTMSLGSGLESNREAAALSRQALASKTLANYQKQEFAIHLQSELARLKLLHDQVHAAEQNTQRAERYYKMTQAEYSRGVKNSPDVLGAAEKLFDMQHKRLEIIRTFQVSKAHMLSKIGL